MAFVILIPKAAPPALQGKEIIQAKTIF